MSRLLENAAQARAHILAHAVSASVPWSAPTFRPWAVNGWQVPVLPVGLVIQGSSARLELAMSNAGFLRCPSFDLSRDVAGLRFNQVVSSAARFFGSVVRLAPVRPERALFESLLPAVQWLEGRSQRATWVRDNADGSRHVVRSYAAGEHARHPLWAMTIARLTGNVIRCDEGSGFIPEIDRRYDLVRDELLEIFAPAALEEQAVSEPWDLEHVSRSLYRLILDEFHD